MSSIVDYIKDKFELFKNISYVSESALNEGKVEEIKAQAGKEGESDPIVYKVPILDEKLCPSCRRAYLDSSGNPRLFKLSELVSNGTNIGRKQSDWLPVLSQMHPHCRCLLQYFEELPNTSRSDYEFDESKQRYILKQKDLSDDSKKVRRSKVHIQVGDKHFDV